MKEKILLIILLLSYSLCRQVQVASAQTASVPSGSGIESDPYQIANLENLYWLSQNSSYWGSEYYYEQTADIDASETSGWDSGRGFSPIGNYDGTNFTGQYNGKGNIIKGLHINSTLSHVGLFGVASGATIDSVGIVGCNIYGGGIRVGALVGYTVSTTISNCYSTGAVSSGGDWLGGLVGQNDGSTINSCYSSATVSSGSNIVGGLVGENARSSAINNSYATGAVSGSNTVGGLVGYLYDATTVSNCYSSGEVSSSDSYVGGLVGRNESSAVTISTISNSYYNSETCGAGSSSGYGTPLSTSDMTSSSKFSGWDIGSGNSGSNIWGIIDGKTYPALNLVGNNAPFAFADTVVISEKLDLDTLSSAILANDYDYETGQNSLVRKINSVTTNYGTYSEGIYAPDYTLVSESSFDTIVYSVGEVADGDTLWGNSATAAIKVQLFEGSGTESDPYQIADLDGLSRLSDNNNYWDKYYVQTADIDASGTSSWNNGSGFSPIGDYDGTNFTGHYNGKGHTIKRLYINRPDSNYVGLFGHAYGATIDSIGIINCDVTGRWNVGALVGQALSSTTISYCYSTGEVSGNTYVAGLTGRIYGGSANSCYSSATVSGIMRAGGLVGENNSTISNCYATGAVTCSEDNYIGGLVSVNNIEGIITKCYYAGEVSCNGSFVGALVGYEASSGSVTNSYFNSETCGDGGSDYGGEALTTAQMQQIGNFSNWDIGSGNGGSNIWGIIDGKTYPALNLVGNNAPFAFADTVVISEKLDLDTLSSAILANDYDYETGQNSLVRKINSVTTNYGSVSNDIYVADIELASESSFDTIVYSVGEVVDGDTLWGNSATVAIKVQPFKGEGTESSPYQIANLDDLRRLSENSRYWGQNYFVQTADIDASATAGADYGDGNGFFPIGNRYGNFNGYYNGKGHTISGLYINRPDSSFVGLFGAVTYGASIDSTGVVGCNITGADLVGGVAGYTYSSETLLTTVTNSYSTGKVSGNSYVGGLVGQNSDYSAINSCYSTASVSSNYIAGGLVGENARSSAISNSYATGAVSGGSCAGGLAGYLYHNTTVSNCYSTGEVSSSDSYVGGLVGRNNSSDVTISTITSSYFNSETCGETAAASSEGTAYTTSQMRTVESFDGWDFSGTWGIREGQTYPALDSVSNNAPFAFADTIAISSAIDFDTLGSTLISNAYDYEIDRENLVYGVSSVTTNYGTYNNGVYVPDFTLASESSFDTFTYVVGEVIPGDTLWGNNAYAAIKAQLFEGSGTESDPYQIADLDDLKNLSAYSNYWDKNFVQTADIDASATTNWDDGYGFSRIGDGYTYFTGSYNGKGHIIKGLYINRPSTANLGLFGYASNASLDSIGIIDCDISGSYRIGALVGQTYNSTTVNNCYSTGLVSGTYTGGLVGYFQESFINNCYSTANVSGSEKVGGLAGENNSSAMSNCYATGAVTSTGNYAGALAGVNYEGATITNCYATGKVTYDNRNDGVLVGLLGSKNISNSYYNSETCGNGSSSYSTGLTTSQMKTTASFEGWDFTGTWGIREGQTYPALDSVSNNAPFAFADTINSSSVEFSALLANDYDYEAAQANLVAAVVDSGNCVVSGTSITLPEGTETGDTIEVSYKVGELLSSGDTLWGNVATALLVKTSSVQIWAGTGTWGETAYWSTGTLPGSADSVIVESGILTLGQDATIGSLTVEAGASLEVTVGYTLTVSGDLTIEGDASGTGCIVNKGTLAVGGTSYVQQYMTGNKWHIVSPNATTGSISAFMQEAGNDIPTFVDNDTTFYGIVEYEEGINDWSDYFITATTDVFEACKGYMLYRGSDGVVTFSGSLYSGNQSIALTKDGAGWNCVGNPYTSAIDINYDATTSFLAANADGLDENYGAIYLWVEGEGYDGTVSQYKVISNASFEFGSDRTLSDNFVAPGQAFMVKAASGTSVASFTPDMQTTGSYLLKSAKAAWPAFRLDLTSGSSTASTVVAFNGSMTNGLDKTYDAGVMGNPGALEISSRLVGGDKGIGFAIQCLPGDYENLVIPVDVYSEDGGEISISAETASLPSACKVILEDKSTGTYTELTDGESYSATVVAGEAETGRFYIHTGMNTTGTEGLELDGGESFNVYLSGGEIVIEGNVGNSATASLYSITGKRASINKLQAGSRNCIQSQGLAPGVYLLTVTDGGNRYSTKIMIL